MLDINIKVSLNEIISDLNILKEKLKNKIEKQYEKKQYTKIKTYSIALVYEAKDNFIYQTGIIKTSIKNIATALQDWYSSQKFLNYQFQPLFLRDILPDNIIQKASPELNGFEDDYPTNLKDFDIILRY